jgi:Ca2+-binding RTX toxin-like protein
VAGRVGNWIVAKLKTYVGLNMNDTRGLAGVIAYSDDELVIVETDDDSEVRYFGDFRFPGDQWRGTIEAVYAKTDGQTDWFVDGIDVDARYMRTQSSLKEGIMLAFSGNDRLSGSNYSDRLYGYDGADRLYGNSGNDRLSGADGADSLYGGRGRDSLYGGDQNDRLSGSTGDDRLVGGHGNDRLNGGSGFDQFVFNRGDGRDRIEDFLPSIDTVVFDSGARRYSDLDITQSGDNVVVAASRVQVVIEDAFVWELARDDFAFV